MERRKNAGRFLICLLASAYLAACGGGGGGEGLDSKTPSSSGGAPSKPTADDDGARMTVSRTSIAVQADTSAGAPNVEPVDVTITDAEGIELFLHSEPIGNVLSDASIERKSDSSAALHLNVWRPTQLGAGTYNGGLKLSICRDDACTLHLKGSPVSILISYTVTGNALPTPIIDLSGYPVTLLGKTSEDGAQSQLTYRISDIPANGLYLHAFQPTGDLVAHASFGPVQRSSSTEAFGAFDFTLQQPSDLGSGIHEGAVEFQFCLETACEHIVGSGNYRFPLKYYVSLSEGLEYTQQRIYTPGSEAIAYGSANNKIYLVSRSTTALQGAHDLKELDPLNGTSFGVSLPLPALGQATASVTTSDDGAVAYVYSTQSSTVYRVALPSMTEDRTISLGADSHGAPTYPRSLAVAPSALRTIAVSTTNSNWGTGVRVLDDGIARSQRFDLNFVDFETSADLAWGADATRLFFSQTLPRAGGATEFLLHDFSVDASGLMESQRYSSTAPLLSLHYQHDKLFTIDAVVRDASNGAVLGKLNLPDGFLVRALVPNDEQKRVYVLGEFNGESRHWLLCFDLTSYDMLTMTDLGANPLLSNGGSFIGWGEDKLAYQDGTYTYALAFKPPQKTSSPTFKLSAVQTGKAWKSVLHIGMPAFSNAGASSAH